MAINYARHPPTKPVPCIEVRFSFEARNLVVAPEASESELGNAIPNAVSIGMPLSEVCDLV